MEKKLLITQRIVKSKNTLGYPAKTYFQLWKIDGTLIMRFIRLTLVPESSVYFNMFQTTECLQRSFRISNKSNYLFRMDFSMAYETFLAGLDFKILIMGGPIRSS